MEKVAINLVGALAVKKERNTPLVDLLLVLVRSVGKVNHGVKKQNLKNHEKMRKFLWNLSK